MTKKEVLKWRLKTLPTGDEVAKLVEQKVITADEARDMLFNTNEEDGDKVAALQEEIKFLRDLVDKLAAKNNSWNVIYQEYQRIRPIYPVWYSNYSPIMATYSSTLGSTTLTSGTTSYGIQSANKQGLSSLN